MKTLPLSQAMVLRSRIRRERDSLHNDLMYSKFEYAFNTDAEKVTFEESKKQFDETYGAYLELDQMYADFNQNINDANVTGQNLLVEIRAYQARKNIVDRLVSNAGKGIREIERENRVTGETDVRYINNIADVTTLESQSKHLKSLIRTKEDELGVFNSTAKVDIATDFARRLEELDLL